MTSPLPTKVLHIANWWFPRSGSPFDGIFVRRHVEVAATIAEVAVLHLDDRLPGRRRGVVVERVDLPCAPAVAARFVRPPERWPLLLRAVAYQTRYLEAAREGLRAIREIFPDPDLVHVHEIPPPGFLRLRRVFADRPLVLTEHNSDWMLSRRGGVEGLRDRMLRPLLREAAVVTSPSQALGRGLQARGFRFRFLVLPNVVDTQVFAPPPEKGSTLPPLRLLHVSCLLPVKNVAGILRALARARGSGLDLCLSIVGDGPERAALEALTADLDLNPWVDFRGAAPASEVATEMQRAHAVVLFSHLENAPCVLAEAAACGVPAVASSIGGVPELVGADGGWLVPPGDEVALAAVLMRLPELLQGFNPATVRQRAVATFSPAAVATRLGEIYSVAMSDRGASA